jgi:hypothetical protein
MTAVQGISGCSAGMAALALVWLFLFARGDFITHCFLALKKDH